MTPFRLASLTVVRIKTRFRIPIRHAAAARHYNDALIVCLRDSEGRTGYGECLPRDYLTGESVASATDAIENRWFPAFREREFSGNDPYSELTQLYRQASSERSLAAYGAVDLALYDLWQKRGGHLHPPASRSGKPPRPTFTIPLGWPVTLILGAVSRLGFRDFKIKCRDLKDIANIVRMKSRFPNLRVRLDANCALPTTDAFISELAQTLSPDIWALEAPFPKEDLKAMAKLQALTSCALIADESLCTYEDAIAHRDLAAARIWNLRLGKNGGITGVRQLIELAEPANIGIGLGVLVGETRALSDPHAALAPHHPFLFVENGFNRLLLRGDPLKKLF